MPIRGSHGREGGGQLGYAPPQAISEVLALGDVSEQHGAQRQDQRPEGAERGVWAGLHADDGEVRGLVEQRLQERRLPDPGLPDELDGGSLARSPALERRAQQPELGLAAQERAGHGPPWRAPRPTDDLRPDHRALPLDGERRDRRAVERLSDAAEHALVREDATLGRMAHHPRREVDRVAHGGPRAPLGRAHVERERTAAVHARAHVERPGATRHVEQRVEHAVGVVRRRGRRTRDEHHLAAVPVCVRADEGDPVRLARLLETGVQLVQRRGDRLGAVGREEAVEAAELEESDRHRTVLAFPRLVIVEMRGEPDPGVQARRPERGARNLERAAARPRTHDEPLPLELGRKVGAGADRPCLGARLLFEDGCHERAGDDQLPVGSPCEVEVQPAGGDAGGQGQRNGCPAHASATDRPHRLLHRDGRAARPFGMAIAFEEDEHGVAAELQDVSSELLRVVQDVGEDGVHRFGELLGAYPPAPGEPLAELGEARDVGEQQRGVELAPAQLRLGREPARMNGRQISLRSLTGAVTTWVYSRRQTRGHRPRRCLSRL